MKIKPVEEMLDDLCETVIQAENLKGKIETELLEEVKVKGGMLAKLDDLILTTKNIIRKMLKPNPSHEEKQ